MRFPKRKLGVATLTGMTGLTQLTGLQVVLTGKWAALGTVLMSGTGLY